MPEVGGSLVGVELGRNLELARQGMKDPHPGFGPVHGLVVDDVILAGQPVFLLRFEAFLLNPEKIDKKPLISSHNIQLGLSTESMALQLYFKMAPMT